MNTPQPPRATYSFRVHVHLEGITAPLEIRAESVNEIKRALRLLAANGLLAGQEDSSAQGEDATFSKEKT